MWGLRFGKIWGLSKVNFIISQSVFYERRFSKDFSSVFSEIKISKIVFSIKKWKKCVSKSVWASPFGWGGVNWAKTYSPWSLWPVYCIFWAFMSLFCEKTSGLSPNLRPDSILFRISCGVLRIMCAINIWMEDSFVADQRPNCISPKRHMPTITLL